MGMFEDSLAPPTRFDLSFRLGDIPVRVHPFFWLSAVLLGIDLRRPGPEMMLYLAIWTGILFVSILVHELGHILMGRYFGRRGHILLTGFCGLAIGSSEQPYRWQRNLVYLAGPGAGFVLAAVATAIFWTYNAPTTLWILGRFFGIVVDVPANTEPVPDILFFVMNNVLWINIFWGLVNLLPVWPLDGGQVCREVCQHYRGRDGMRASLIISLATAAGFAGLALLEMILKRPIIPFLPLGGSLFPVLFFAILALQSWQLLQFVRRAGPDWEEQREESAPRGSATRTGGRAATIPGATDVPFAARSRQASPVPQDHQPHGHGSLGGFALLVLTNSTSGQERSPYPTSFGAGRIVPHEKRPEPP